MYIAMAIRYTKDNPKYLSMLDEKLDRAHEIRRDKLIREYIRKSEDMEKEHQDSIAAINKAYEDRQLDLKKEQAAMMCKVFGICAVGLATAAAASSYFSKGGNNKKTKRRRGGAYKKRTMRRR
jgi:hypothetical protein